MQPVVFLMPVRIAARGTLICHSYLVSRGRGFDARSSLQRPRNRCYAETSIGGGRDWCLGRRSGEGGNKGKAVEAAFGLLGAFVQRWSEEFDQDPTSSPDARGCCGH